ncbi:MAG: dihydroxyacetone kinase subunit L [Candidatus Dormibacteraeota bacterium]|nr:dihydroxyacetone kinase subunit L [Candidatus Dormibacteraeota bacterium]
MGGVILDAGATRSWLERFGEALTERAAELTRLDAAIGDGDHGTNMDRGFRAVQERVLTQDSYDLPTLLRQTGMTLIGTVGGAAGPLYGTAFMRMSQSAAGQEGLTLEQLAEALGAALEGVQQRGKAEPGEKTMVDALVPAVKALRESAAGGADAATALRGAAEAAEGGAEATIPMLAKKGRASYLGERSIGHQDPGATSSAQLIRSLAEAVTH